MRVVRGCARFEARDPPASRQLKRSPNMGRHLRGVGSSGIRLEQHNRNRGYMLRVIPPIRTCTSAAIQHHLPIIAAKWQGGCGGSCRTMTVRRSWRVQARLGCPARSPPAPVSQRYLPLCCSRAHDDSAPFHEENQGSDELPFFTSTIPPPTRVALGEECWCVVVLTLRFA